MARTSLVVSVDVNQHDYLLAQAAVSNNLMVSVDVKQHGYLLAQAAVSNNLMVSADVNQHDYLLAQASSESRRDQEQVVEVGSHSWTVCLAEKLFLNSCFSDTVFVTLLRTAAETAISEVHKLLHRRGPHLLNVVVLAVADGLFGLHGSECRDELFIGTLPPPFPRP